ncbi:MULTISPECIES: glycoside hydrolase family 11 protein [unclassified Agarivorans]|nr:MULTISPECIES: glycoside hydrolase family 11 protein [unclassified Agarivorans]MDO6686172.1 glycoside hydrolase family 11 protein [Agarivorans sp. 3_MG-2023]MDO6716379.1 glycoside hydrolase family 11 protein [Agarivorans sp. 2_MG-2023]
MKTPLLALSLAFGSLLSLTPTTALAASIGKTICDPAADSDNGYGSGTYRGHFYSWFELSQNNIKSCDVKIGFYNDAGRHYRAEWNMAKSWGEDAIGGLGWENGARYRKIGYNVGELTSNSNIQKALVALYGWSCSGSNSQEYYVVDSWKGPGKFVPWDENEGAPAESKGTVNANGATYDVYLVDRNGAQYCGNGDNRQFKQYWSVRRSPTSTGSNQELDFGPHANRWDNSDLGFKTNGIANGYQILAIEVFGDANLNHKGAVDLSLWLR